MVDHVLAIDWVVFGTANLLNLLMAGIFLVRRRGLSQLEHRTGWVVNFLALPLCAAVLVNLQAGRESWSWILPLLTIIFIGVEIVLDYLLKSDFRRSRWLALYLISYYIGLLAMIGYSFAVGKPYGFVTLVTYFANQAATFYSYARVGHGQPAASHIR
jgi:hypothetical protein